VWEDWKVQGKVDKTFSRGKLIVDGDAFLGSAEHGQYLKRTV
jgi:dihydropyrimidinase